MPIDATTEHEPVQATDGRTGVTTHRPRLRDPDAPGIATGAPRIARPGVLIAAVLLLLGSLPDSMVPPALPAIAAAHFGIAETAAYWFVTVNIFGALAAIPALVFLRRRLSPVVLLASAAIANAVLLAALAGVTDYRAALGLRFFEGMADLVVLAVLLDLIAKSGASATRGRRIGLGTTTLLLGLGLGALVGGWLGDRPVAIFYVGAAACALVAGGAIVGAPWLRRSVVTCPVIDGPLAVPQRSRPLWPIVFLMGSDRALAGVVVVTIPMLLRSRLGFSAGEVGWVIAMPLLLMAILAWPAGLLGDRVGNVQLRGVAGLIYAIALAALPLAAGMCLATALAVAMCFGVAASMLMPTTIALAARTGRGSVAMAATQAGGNLGYLVGIAGAGALLSAIGGARPDSGAYALVVTIFALGHVVVAGIATLNVRRVPISIAIPRVTRPTV